jgi:hypothetical protein
MAGFPIYGIPVSGFKAGIPVSDSYIYFMIFEPSDLQISNSSKENCIISNKKTLETFIPAISAAVATARRSASP